MSKKELKDILWSVCARIDAAIDGRCGEIELDTRFEKIGGGSPRKTGSRLSPEKVQKVINDCIKRVQK